jgi:hypothetical protein
MLLTQLSTLIEGYTEARHILQRCVNTPGADCQDATATANRLRTLLGAELDAYVDARIERYLAAH